MPSQFFLLKCMLINMISEGAYKMVEVEAAAFRRLVSHLQTHTEAQNLDLMILADFCRNCLAKWVVSGAAEQGIEMDYEQAREIIYGMPYNEWKDKYQLEATPSQLAALEAKQKAKHSD